MSGHAKRVYGFYNNTCGLGPQYFGEYLKNNVCPGKKITLYYRLSISPEDSDPNYSVTNFVTDPVITAFRGISNLYMTESDWRTYNKTILTFQSLRSPTNTSLPPECKVPSMYNETLNINVPDNNNNYDKNYLQAAANYIDNSDGFATTTPFVEYGITMSGGIFSGYTKIRINFYNDGFPPGYTGTTSLGPVRVMEILS
jgi:hypothetical protein